MIYVLSMGKTETAVGQHYHLLNIYFIIFLCAQA